MASLSEVIPGLFALSIFVIGIVFLVRGGPYLGLWAHANSKGVHLTLNRIRDVCERRADARSLIASLIELKECNLDISLDELEAEPRVLGLCERLNSSSATLKCRTSPSGEVTVKYVDAGGHVTNARAQSAIEAVSALVDHLEQCPHNDTE